MRSQLFFGHFHFLLRLVNVLEELGFQPGPVLTARPGAALLAARRLTTLWGRVLALQSGAWIDPGAANLDVIMIIPRITNVN